MGTRAEGLRALKRQDSRLCVEARRLADAARMYADQVERGKTDILTAEDLARQAEKLARRPSRCEAAREMLEILDCCG